MYVGPPNPVGLQRPGRLCRKDLLTTKPFLTRACHTSNELGVSGSSFAQCSSLTSSVKRPTI